MNYQISIYIFKFTWSSAPSVLQFFLLKSYLRKTNMLLDIRHLEEEESGAPNVNFRKIFARKTIWDLDFSEHLL